MTCLFNPAKSKFAEGGQVCVARAGYKRDKSQYLVLLGKNWKADINTYILNYLISTNSH